MSDDVKGTIMRGADGALYFIRDTVWDACKVTEKDMAAYCEEVLSEHSGDTQGFALSFGKVEALSAAGPFNQAKGPLGTAASTVMCPGVMKSGKIRVTRTGRF